MSKNSNYTIDLSNVRTKIKSFQEQGKHVVYSATFLVDGKKQKLVDMAEISQLSLITRNLKCETPEKITIELFDKNDTRNPLWVKPFLFDGVAPANKPQPATLGEAEINQMVDQRIAERQREIDFEELKNLAKDLSSENEELQDRIEELEGQKEQLEIELERKKSVRYYAGMLGDILEGFGINKEKIKKPLAELMGIDEEKPSPKQVQAHAGDSSGIVDEEPTGEDKKRLEVIDLIHQYLNSLPNTTLAKVFQVFSAIEQNPALADELLDFLSNPNPQDNE
jgi:FtsZ-binding cell division protein ZapB